MANVNSHCKRNSLDRYRWSAWAADASAETDRRWAMPDAGTAVACGVPIIAEAITI